MAEGLPHSERPWVAIAGAQTNTVGIGSVSGLQWQAERGRDDPRGLGNRSA